MFCGFEFCFIRDMQQMIKREERLAQLKARLEFAILPDSIKEAIHQSNGMVVQDTLDDVLNHDENCQEPNQRWEDWYWSYLNMVGDIMSGLEHYIPDTRNEG